MQRVRGSCLAEGSGLTLSYLGELPSGERKGTAEREMDGWTQSAPLSGACSSDSQTNEDLGLRRCSRLDSRALRSSRFKGGAVPDHTVLVVKVQ